MMMIDQLTKSKYIDRKVKKASFLEAFPLKLRKNRLMPFMIEMNS